MQIKLDRSSFLKFLFKLRDFADNLGRIKCDAIESCKKFGQTELIKKSNCLDIN